MNESPEASPANPVASAVETTTVSPPLGHWRRHSHFRTRRVFIALAALVALTCAFWSLAQQYVASRHHQAAQAAYERHHYSQAKFHVEKASAQWSNDPAVLLLSA